MFTSLAMLAASAVIIGGMVIAAQNFTNSCRTFGDAIDISCPAGVGEHLKQVFGTWGGFSSSATLTSLTPDSLQSEFLAFVISNGAQFVYSLLYLLLNYNITLISMEHEWGTWETKRKRPRCTIVSGRPFEQSYFLQLPSTVLMPFMGYSALMHWLLGQAISTTETIFKDPVHGVEHSLYTVSITFHC
jgi:hypothetical protein